MAKLRKWRVLVLERHFKIGGFTHTFSRPGGWSWDVGLHYVGEMGDGMMGRRLFDFITDGKVKWQPMPDVYDVFALSRRSNVKGPQGRSEFSRARSIDAFPEERASIEQYFRDLKSAQGWLNRHFMAMVGAAPLQLDGAAVKVRFRSLPLGLTRALSRKAISRRAASRRAGVAVGGLWTCLRASSAFVTHAVIASHYFNGAWYPAGGAGEIAEAAGAVIRAAGGELLANHEVTQILVEGERAVGVEANVKKGKDGVRAGISRARGGLRCRRLEHVRAPAALPPICHSAANSQRRPPASKCVELFLGLRWDPRALGFHGENYWIFSSFDHDEMYARRDELLEGRAPMAYLSFPSSEGSASATRHTAEIDRATLLSLARGTSRRALAAPRRRL